MTRTAEPKVMPPVVYKTTYGIEVQLSPVYSGGHPVAALCLTMPTLSSDSSIFDIVKGPWASHEEAFKAGCAAAEAWIGALDPSQRPG